MTAIVTTGTKSCSPEDCVSDYWQHASGCESADMPVSCDDIAQWACKNSFVPAGPVIRTIPGPMPASATNSNFKNGQHSLSIMISSAAKVIHFLSPGIWK